MIHVIIYLKDVFKVVNICGEKKWINPQDELNNEQGDETINNFQTIFIFLLVLTELS